MNYEQLKLALSQASWDADSAFACLGEITRFVNQQATHNQGRDLVIRALAVSDQFGRENQEILVALVRSVGLFPYMTDFLESSYVDDFLAYQMHKVRLPESEVVFHSLQAKIYHQLLAGKNVVVSASTSVGKSLVIDGILATGKFRNVVIVVPTIALIDETRKRLTRRFGAKCSIITHQSQRQRHGVINIYVLTQERVLHRDDLGNVDFFAIDEFYKVNLGQHESRDRAVDLNLAFHRLAKTGAQFYLLGPNIQTVRGLEKFEYYFIPSEFSTVAVDVVNYDLPTFGPERSAKLLSLCHSIDGPTIVYCQSPPSASRVAEFLVASGGFDKLSLTDDAVRWISEEYHPDWCVCKALAVGIGIHHGGVPRALQQYFIRLFNERKIKILVCTSTIIEGVNTVAKNVIVYDRRRRNNVLDYFTYKNIEGRAGRMNEYFIGRVFVLESPPDDSSLSVEFAVGTQKPDTPLSLLLDLGEDDLSTPSKERLSEAFKDATLGEETIRANRYTPIEHQEAVAAAIRANLDHYEHALTWVGVPSGEQLKVVCDLIYEYLSGDLLRGYNVHSGDSLAWILNSIRMHETLKAHIDACIDGRHPDWSISQAVDEALKFIRNVVCQRFPRDLMTIDAIQRDIFIRSGRNYGQYGLFAEQAENLFMPSALYALDEYGVPIQSVRKLRPAFGEAVFLDSVLQKLKHLPLSKYHLAPFEVEILKDVQTSLVEQPEAL